MFLFNGEEAKGNELRFATHDEADVMTIIIRIVVIWTQDYSIKVTK